MVTLMSAVEDHTRSSHLVVPNSDLHALFDSEDKQPVDRENSSVKTAMLEPDDYYNVLSTVKKSDFPGKDYSF